MGPDGKWQELEGASQRMMEGAHWFGMMPIAALVVVLLIAFVLFLFFRRPASAEHLVQTCMTNAPLCQPGEPEDIASLPREGKEQETYLVVPDISGYTDFLSLSRFSLGHAQNVISQLLEAVIKAGAPQLKPYKVEGDAILFFGLADSRGKLVGGHLGRTVIDLLTAFYDKRLELEQANLCPCDTCRHIQNLDLKIILHRGPVIQYRLDSFLELGGMPVVLVHRLLKNSTGLRRYLLATESSSSELDLPVPLKPSSHAEVYPEIGEVRTSIYPFELNDLPLAKRPDRGKEPLAGAKDMARKLAVNAATLGRTLRSAP